MYHYKGNKVAYDCGCVVFYVTKSILLLCNENYNNVFKCLWASRRRREFKIVVCLSKSSVFSPVGVTTAG